MNTNQIDQSYAMFMEQHEDKLAKIEPTIVQWIYYNGYRDAMKAVLEDLRGKKEKAE